MIEREYAGRLPSGQMKVTVTLGPQTTLAEALNYALDHGLSSSDVIVTGGHLTYERPPTAQETAAREQAVARATYHADVWLAKRFKERFGNIAPDQVRIEQDR